MTGKKLQRVLACLLAVLLLSQVGAFSPAVLAADSSGYTLHDGTAVIPAGTSAGDVNRILAAALVVGFDQMSSEEQNRILAGEWQYECEGKSAISTKNTAWGPITGFESSKKVGFVTTKHSHPALSANEDGSYPIRLKLADGTLTNEVKVYKAQKPVSSIALKDGVTITLPYNADVSINFDALRERIFDQVVESTTPDMTVNDVTIEYYATATTGAVGELGHDWVSLEGGKVSIYDYPAISEGNQQIRISYAGNGTYGAVSAEVAVTFADRADSHIVLKSGQKVALQYNDDVTVNYDALRADILQQVVDEGTTPALTTENTEIKYYAASSTGLFHDWVSLEGEGVYPAISAGDQKIQISFKGDDAYKASSDEVTVTFTERPSVTATQKENPTFRLRYTDKNGTVEPDYENIQQQVWDAVIESTDPSLTASDVTIEYYATPTITIGGVGKNWAPLEGITTEIAGQKVGYPAIPEGTQKVRISWAGNKNYAPWTVEADVNITGRPEVEVATKENPTFQLAFTADGEAIYDNIRQQVWDAVVVSTKPALTVDDVTIEYYATATTGATDKLGHAWVALTGGKVNGLTYPAIGEGTQEVRITWGGSKDYAAWQWQGNVAVTGRADAPFRLKEGVTEGMTVAIVYNRDQSINYEETAQALRDALLESTDSNISIDDVTVQYNAGIDVIKNYQPLNYSPTGSDIIDQFVKFGLGSQTIHFVWNGNAAYKPLKLDDVTVKMSDNRIKSRIVLKDGVSITYHMDPAVMEQEIFENLIDWDASTLPEKSTLSVADFTFEYYGENVLGEEDGGISGGVPDWAPVAGGTVNFLNYPQMGAGENQKVRVSYSGNGEYRPCKNVEGTLTVNKAKVSVKVHSTSIYADEAKDKLGEGFVTTDPADKFDIYTIYGGMTSDVTTSVFVQLPERMTNGTIIMLIDKTLKDLDKKTLTEMMQQGTTVGELRKLLSEIVGKGDKLPQPMKDLLKKVGIDIDTLVKLNEALNKLPGLLDNVRVAFGTPDQAGIYTVCAVTNNKNYETGFGMGTLVVKKHYSGVKLQWNQTIPNGKLTTEEAKNFDFGVTLMYDGNPAKKQTNVHYLYSGFTSKWKPYSSTTTPPTEPGRYVVTVVTLGGNYQAAPITRAFQITK